MEHSIAVIRQKFFSFFGTPEQRQAIRHADMQPASRANYQPNCALSIPSCLVNPSAKPKTKKSERRPAWEKYPKEYASAKRHHLTNNQMIAFGKKRLAEPPIIAYYNEQGELSMFRGAIKGSKRYNEFLTQKLQARAKYMAQQKRFFYFFTMTYDVATHGEDAIEAYQKFAKEKNRLMKKISDNFNAEYISVTEATNKGYPHAHVILAFDQPLDASDADQPNQTELTSGRLYDYLKERVLSPVFNLQIASPDGLEYYLTKYIYKGFNTYDLQELEKKESLDPDERKALLTLSMPILSNTRQLSYSTYPKSFYENRKVSSNVLYTDDLESIEDIELNLERSEQALRSLLNNVRLNCRCKLFLILDKATKEAMEPNLGFYEKPEEALKTEIRNHGVLKSCPGCAITEFLNTFAERA